MLDEKMNEIIREWSGGAFSQQYAETLVARLYNANYRLDPYHNGKSKGELLAMLDARELELARARNLLYHALDHLPEEDLEKDVRAFLAETNPIKSFDLPGGEERHES